ncbi:MAG: mechanosensitive ion channel family protein [Candidatus Micrarchaeota archaeon]|nr:mechanosensitive ion channel family protein [Candidatus Micrarchaeota archaeon]
MVATIAVDLMGALGIAVAISALSFFVVRRIVNGSKLPDPIKRSIKRIFAGPVSAGIVGFALFEAVRLFSITLPALNQDAITIAIEIVILAVTVRTFGVIANDVMTNLTGHKEADKVLVYGVYTLGLIALSFILLTSPASPVVVTGVWQVVGFGTGLILVYLVTYIANAAFKKYATVLSRKEPQMAITVTFGRRLILAVIALVGVAIVTFTSFPGAGATVASLFVAAGFASIVIGLAAQSSLSNIFAGMIVSTSRPFRIGDAVLFQMPWGAEWCWVEDLRLSYTILKTWDKRRLVIPNQIFLNTPLVNYTMTDQSKLCIVFIQVPYEADLDTVIEIMKDEARKHPSAVPTEGLPAVHVMEYDESGIQLRLLLNAPDQGTNFQMSKDLLYNIRKRLMQKGISIQYPRREVIFRDAPPEFFTSKANSKGMGHRKPSHTAD